MAREFLDAMLSMGTASQVTPPEVTAPVDEGTPGDAPYPLWDMMADVMNGRGLRATQPVAPPLGMSQEMWEGAQMGAMPAMLKVGNIPKIINNTTLNAPAVFREANNVIDMMGELYPGALRMLRSVTLDPRLRAGEGLYDPSTYESLVGTSGPIKNMADTVFHEAFGHPLDFGGVEAFKLSQGGRGLFNRMYDGPTRGMKNSGFTDDLFSDLYNDAVKSGYAYGGQFGPRLGSPDVPLNEFPSTMFEHLGKIPQQWGEYFEMLNDAIMGAR